MESIPSSESTFMFNLAEVESIARMVRLLTAYSLVNPEQAVRAQLTYMMGKEISRLKELVNGL